MKQGLFTTIVMGIVWLGSSRVSADYQLFLTTTRESESVPVGNVIIGVSGEVGNRINTEGALGTWDVRLPANSELTVRVETRDIFLRVRKSATVQGQDLNINSTFIPQTIVKSYTRGGVQTNLSDVFTIQQRTDLGVNFGLATGAAAREYQFFFGAPGLPAWNASDPTQMLGLGYTVTNPQSSFAIPASVFSHLQAGNSLYVPVRVIDFAFRYHDTSFEFDLQPMGGGAAIPEPSMWWMIGFLASSFAGRESWKWWRARRRRRLAL